MNFSHDNFTQLKEINNSILEHKFVSAVRYFIRQYESKETFRIMKKILKTKKASQMINKLVLELEKNAIYVTLSYCRLWNTRLSCSPTIQCFIWVLLKSMTLDRIIE